MRYKLVFFLIGAVGIAAIGIAMFFGFFSLREKEASPVQVSTDNINLFPPRSQERIADIEDKDTAFEEAGKVNPLDCADFYCFEKYYQNLVAENTIAAAFVDLKVRYDENVLVRSVCHPLVHVIGRAATKKYPSVAGAYVQGDHFCWSGYYHGVMEGLLRETKPEDLPGVINSICESIPGKAVYSFDYYNCVHGLGHGVMYITENELFEALELCDNLQGQWEQESCYGGVFMENVITDFENHFTKYLKPTEPLYPCTAVKEQYKRPCYLMQTSYVLKVNGYNFADAFAQCSTIEEQHKNTCYQSIGRDASGSTVSDVQRTRSHCMLGKDENQQTQCVIGAVKDFISYFHSDVQAKQLCDTFEENIRHTCLFIADQYYRSFTN